jgi:serine/threonine protein kinase
MADPVIRVNDIVAGKYRVERMLGEGGMGVVVAARHLELDQPVAIKFLLPQIAEQASSAERFRREAKAAARIKSEHVCRVLDVGTLESGVPYMVMEYLEGCDLSSEVSFRGRLPAAEAIDYVLQACEAVAEAHAAGIVHRDLKPENLYLARRPDGTRAVKVLDFGVSKSLLEGAGHLKLTRTASIVGSPLYMSPEQLDAAKDVDVRADIWALGTILYELMTGRTPFAADSIPQLVAAVLHSAPPTFAALGVTAPGGLEPAVLKALEKERNNRFSTVADFARGIAPFAPPHAAVSASRIARVLAMKDSDPAGSMNATVDSGERFRNARASQTMDVSVGKGTIRTETPQAWGNTDDRQERRRRSMIVLAIAFPFVVLLVFVLRPRPAADPIPKPQPATQGPVAETETPAPQGGAVEPARAAPVTTPPVAPSPPEPVSPPAPIVAPVAAKTAGANGTTVSSTSSRHLARPRTPASAAPTLAASVKTEPPAPTAPKAEAPTEAISDFGGRR